MPPGRLPRIGGLCNDWAMRENEEKPGELEAEIQRLQEEIDDLEAERQAFADAIQGAFPNLIDEMMRRQQEKGAPLTPGEISRYTAETKERAAAIAAGFTRLQELGIERDQLVEIASADDVLERIHAAIEELEHPSNSG
jgi:chromosome segregation ATPase